MLAARLDWKIFALCWVGILAIAAVLAPDPPSGWDLYIAEMEVKLEHAWHARHPGPPLPDACEYDEVRAGTDDVDPSPGNELVIMSDRLGIAVFAETGELLAMADPKGCRSAPANWWFNTNLQGDDRYRGIVVREETRGCRSATWVTLIEREGDTLVTHARYRDQDTDQCAWIAGTGPSVSRWVTHATPTPRGVTLRVEERGEDAKLIIRTCSITGRWVSGECRFLVEDDRR